MASTPGRIRPWRHLAAFAGIVVVLYALVFFTGDKAHAQARHRPAGRHPGHADRAHRVGREPPREQLLQAQSIIEQRVNGLGVSGAEVVLDGTNITITVPGEEGDQAPVARADGAAAVPRGRRRPWPRRPRRLRRTAAAPLRRPRPTPRPPRRPAPRRPPTGRDDCPRRGPPATPGHHAGRARRRSRSALPAAPPAARPGHTARRRARRPAATPADPAVAAAIDAARATRQSMDASVQAQALQALDCAATIRCAATTTRRCRWSAATRTAPRSTCSARASSGHPDLDRAGRAEQPGRRLGHRRDLQERRRGDLGRLHVEERR